MSWDCLISFQGSRYSVPSRLAGKNVWVRACQGRALTVYDQSGTAVASHVFSQRKGATVINEEHYEGLRGTRGTPRTRVLLEDAFLQAFPDQAAFLEKVYIQQKLNPVPHLQSILELAKLYSKEAMLEAFELATRYNTFSHRFIRGVLEQRLPSDPGLTRGPMPLVGLPRVDVRCDMTAYQQLLGGR